MGKNYLAQCEQEQLHLSGAIQDHGTLLAVGADGRVTHAAANIPAFLGQGAEAWLGRDLPQRLAELVAKLPTAPGARRFFKSSVEGVDGVLDLSVNRSEGGELLLEFTPEGEIHPLASERSSRACEVFADEDALAAGRQRLLDEIALMTSAHRVLYYAFYEEGDGEVVSEVREGDVFGSYLGLRFPASDIPQIARSLYLKNPWRLIPDARREPVPLLGLMPQPPDLTRSDLRSVSPVHRVYLANMGVVGSLSFPVVIAGSLSALISVHHHESLPLPHSLIEHLAEEVRSFNLSLAAMRAHSRMRMIDNLVRRFDELRGVLQRHGDLLSAWPEVAPLLLREFRVDGAMLCLDDDCASVGHGFEVAALAAFEDWFLAGQGDLVWVGDNLGRQVPGFPLSEIAGVLALRIQPAAGRGLRIYLTRCEHIHEVAWGGNPHKPVEYHDGVLGITPRRSFEKWVEKRLGYSRPWENETRLLGLKLRELLQPEVRI